MSRAAAILTAADQPASRPLAEALLRGGHSQLTLCPPAPSLLPALRAAAPSAQLRCCLLSEALDPHALERALEGSDALTLLHAPSLRCPAAAASNPVTAVHRNLLLTRQVLQSAIATTPDRLVLLSSEHATSTGRVLGASLLAAEVSCLEAAPHLEGCSLVVLRLPAGFDAATPEPALQLQQAAASRAALQALAGCLAEGPQLIHWPQGLEAPEHLVMEALDAALPPLQAPLLPWLQQLSGPLQSADQGRVGEALLQLVAAGPAPMPSAIEDAPNRTQP